MTHPAAQHFAPGRRAGLTLAELIVALLIGSMTLVITAQATSAVRRWGARLEQAGQRQSQMATLYQFTQTVLGETVPVSRKDKDGQRPLLFTGARHDVRFVRAEPGYPSRAGLYQYRLFGTKAGDGWSLVLERALLSDPAQFGTMATPVRLRLYQGPQEPVFSYFSNGVWLDEWSKQAQMPTLVRFAMQNWPGLTIPMAKKNAALNKKKSAKKSAKSQPGKTGKRRARR